MNGARVEVTLPIGKQAFGTLIGPPQSHGPSDILVDGTSPSRQVEREDWDYLRGEEPEAGRG